MSTRGKWLEGCLQKSRSAPKNPASEARDLIRCFQICVNILEGKKYAWGYPSQATSYVIVALDKVKYRTSVRQGMRVPFYKENFVFELYTSMCELKRKFVWLAVMEPGCHNSPRLLGEAGVDMAHLWGQPNHTVTHKWVQLSLPNEGNNSPVGYLKIDVSITVRYEMVNDPMSASHDRLNDDLLLPCGSEQQPACYQVTVYRAYNIPCSAQTRPDMLGKPPSTTLKVIFCDIMAETNVQARTNNPIYLERVSMVELFPSVCEVIQLEVCLVGGAPKVLASTKLKLSEISHGGENGFLPTFGPSLLHMYGPWDPSSSADNGPFHRGALLVSMKTIVPYYRKCIQSVNVEPISSCQMDLEWIIEDFAIFCPVFEVSMLNKSTSGTSCGIAITLGEIPFGSTLDQDADEFSKRLAEIKLKKQHYTGGMNVRWNNPVSGHLEFDTFPILQLAARLPDFRFRMYRNNVIIGIVTDLETELSEISKRLKNKDYGHPNDLLAFLHCCNDDAAAKIQKFLDLGQYLSCSEDIQKYTTELDQRLNQLQKEKIEKIYCRLVSQTQKCRYSESSCSRHKVRFSDDRVNAKKTVKIMLAEIRGVIQELKDLIFKTPDGWPHITVWLLNNGSRVAHTNMAPSDVIHSVISEQNGPLCGKIQTVYLKPIKCTIHRPADCNCIAAKVELMAWMGTFRQRSAFRYCLPEGYICTEAGLSYVECCVNIYRAKLGSDCNIDTSISPFVRVNFMNNVKDTQICPNTTRPVWREVLRVSTSAKSSPQRLESSPPQILVEVYHWDSTQTGEFGKIDLLGRVTLEPLYFIEENQDPPRLEWLDLHLGTEHVGRIQMSAQILQNTESILRKTWIAPQQELLNRSSDQIAQMTLNSDRREPLPDNLLPANTSYKMDVYFWGLRDVSISNKPRVTLELEDITMKSAIITDSQPNCNFPVARMSQTFQGNLTDGSSPLTVKLYDTTTFGRALFAGVNVVNKPQKYLVTWVPKKERDEYLYMKALQSDCFTEVNRNTYLKKNSIYPVIDVYTEKTVRFKDDQLAKSKSFWEKIIFPKETNEEESIMLLPMYTKEKNYAIKDTEDDWWTRYYASDKSSGDKDVTANRIKIYDSELEAQPEYSKFKDWCRTIKIYNGEKTGIPDKDEKLRCGYLKACIAIYEWPPATQLEAVSNSGVDLEKGYFENWPTNDPALYLVRVYAVKCTDLVSKGYTASSKCYVAVECSSTKLSDRNASVPRSGDPVFGKMFEFHCNFPEDYLLRISVMNCGSTLPDELIGCTQIDLEDRAYTKHRATVGLAAEYNMNGFSKWRDSDRPSAILGQLCERNNLPPPEFPDSSTVVFNGVEYKDDSATKYPSPLASKENLCLSILHKWDTMPLCGHKLVPEHVETRTLYDPEKPGIEQGKIHLWVDIFPLDSRQAIPAPVTIHPRPDESYELRVTVWDVKDVKITGKTCIYVRAWIGPSDEAQDTDIYTSSNGEGHFNWRMIFQFQYKHTERKLVIHDKGPFTEVTELFPPILVVQVLDIDAPTLHDYLGTLTLDLSRMPRGASAQSQCARRVRARGNSLFARRHARDWWPLRAYDRNTGNYHAAGMIELELSLLPKEKAVLMPVGLGRDPPSPLADPIHQCRSVSTTKSNSMLNQNRQGIWTLVAVGIVVIVSCLYWDLPVVVFSVLPSRDIHDQ